MATIPVNIKSPTGNPQDTTIILGGVDVTKYIQRLDIQGGYDQLFKVQFMGLAYKELDIELQAEVTVIIQPVEGFDIIVELQSNGNTRYRAVRQ